MTIEKAFTLNLTDPLSVECITNRQVWVITNRKQMGVILQKRTCAEYVGPGAAIGGHLDSECIGIHLLGTVEFDVPTTKVMQSCAFQVRMDNIEQIQKICEINTPLQRGIAILEMLTQQFSVEEIQAVPHILLAKLVGVIPMTIVEAWQAFYHCQGTPQNAQLLMN